MKVIDNKENTTFFKNVDIGEVFKISDDSSTYAYMKTISINDEFNKEYNTICLNDGDLLSFGDERKVFTYPSSELVIKR